jgi:hypothetical protein
MVLVYLLEEWRSITGSDQRWGKRRGRNEFPGQARRVCPSPVFFFIVTYVHTMDMIEGVGVSQKSDRPTKKDLE